MINTTDTHDQIIAVPAAEEAVLPIPMPIPILAKNIKIDQTWTESNDQCNIIKYMASHTFGVREFTTNGFIFSDHNSNKKRLMFARLADGRGLTLKIIDHKTDGSESKVYRYVQNISSSIEDVKHIIHYRHYILRFYGSFVTKYEHEIIMTETCSHNLGTVIKSKHSIQLSTRQVWIRQLLRGVEFLHAIYLVHMDIKPDNILVTFSGQVRISDFEAARIVTRDRIYPFLYFFDTNPVQSFTYFPPDFLMTYILSLKFDIWSVGAIIYDMMAIQNERAQNLKQTVIFDSKSCTVFLQLGRLNKYISNINLRYILYKSLQLKHTDRCTISELKILFDNYVKYTK